MRCFSFKSCLIWFYFTCIWTQCPDRQQSTFWLESTRDGKRERCRKDLGRTWKTDQAFTFKDFHFQQSYELNDKLCLKVFVHFTWGGKRSQQRGCLGSLGNSTPAFKIITVRCEIVPIFPVKSTTGLATFFKMKTLRTFDIPQVPWWNPYCLVVRSKIFLHPLDGRLVFAKDGIHVQKLNFQVWQTFWFSFLELFTHHECGHFVWLDWSKFLSDHFFRQELANRVWDHLKEKGLHDRKFWNQPS